MRTLELFQTGDSLRCQRMGPRAFVLRDFALPCVDQLLSALRGIEARSPFRNMITPGGFTMSVALTNCGALGWTTDRRGYRYTGIDPDNGRPWAEMPQVFAKLASEAAFAGGLREFRTRRLPAQSLSARIPAIVTPRPERAEFRCSHCLGLIGHAGDLSIRWARAPRPARQGTVVSR